MGAAMNGRDRAFWDAYDAVSPMRPPPRQRSSEAQERPHCTHWAACFDCEVLTRLLEVQGLTRSDAQAAAEVEHMKANRPGEPK